MIGTNENLKNNHQNRELFHRSLLIMAIPSTIFLTSCSFNFALTGQKTALENQVMGSYKELDDEVLLLASVRGVSKDGKVTESKKISDAAKEAQTAKQNQDFNRDDIDELKEKQILGEALSGDLVVLPKGIGLVDTATEADLRFAEAICLEENRDRASIVKRIISSNENLNQKDLAETKRIYRKNVLEKSPEGTWFQDDNSQWTKKNESKEAPR
ncbi:MAG: DUF1318 domain-containing protein [Proteobacteria bacterium]|nr:DUF1318 domain-containing protein [Pseudomonadota bacterium]